MNNTDIQKINRFTERLPEHLVDHWAEIIDIIQPQTDPYIEHLEMENFELTCKLRDQVKYVLIMELWVKEKKINSVTGFSNMVNFIKEKAYND